MTKRPVLFSGPMVRAILADRKTQTRRVVSPYLQAAEWVAPYSCAVGATGSWSFMREIDKGHPRYGERLACNSIAIDVVRPQYGVAGDRLWVRETWAQWPPRPDGAPSCRVAYRADGKAFGIGGDGAGGQFLIPHGYIQGYADPSLSGEWMGLECYGGKWRPSIHMPRWASRITLEITGVRAERLQAITEEDAIAEGVDAVSIAAVPRQAAWSRRQDFSRLWDSMNAKRGFPWASNPWVWVIEFKRL